MSRAATTSTDPTIGALGPWCYVKGEYSDLGYSNVYGPEEDTAPVAECATEEYAARIAACVNACVGIPDPAEAIRAVREALAALEDVRTMHYEDFRDFARALDKRLDAAHHALALLGGAS